MFVLCTVENMGKSNGCNPSGRKRRRGTENTNVPRVPLSLLRSPFADSVPKHVGHGVADAARNVVVGVGMGMSGLIAATIASGKEEGAVGVAKGLGAGIVTLAGGTLAGVVMGARQLGRGVMNTKAALQQTVRGRCYWCEIYGKWIDVHLDDMLADLPPTDDDIYRKSRKRKNKIMDWVKKSLSPDSNEEDAADADSTEQQDGELGEDFYSILGVGREATADEIRSAYRHKALLLHPDRNIGDADASQRFQRLLDAYNVLSDERCRIEYDTSGKVNPNRVGDGSYSNIEEILGARHWEPFIGRLGWTLHFTSRLYLDGELRKEMKNRRRLRLAKILLPLVDGDDATLEAARPAIVDAVCTRGGRSFMPLVAKQYAAVARQHLTRVPLRREIDRFRTSKWACISSMKLLTKTCVTTLYKAARKRLSGDQLINAALAFCQRDVQQSVGCAANLLLYDLSVTDEHRARRARMLVKISEMIMEICSTCSSSRSEATSQRL
ncbi:chaperone protein DNAj, putative [Trypanosoma equiperdum]|uniref:Chaperone protein DNAj, putative n=1 Tax=Trypanosoma equiperdum TaxID=5694 RepID=A0A1G4ICT6_TRYEQ|nr:chaperone protein DNAj, putative [Trypanosoma equiperdum]